MKESSGSFFKFVGDLICENPVSFSVAVFCGLMLALCHAAWVAPLMGLVAGIPSFFKGYAELSKGNDLAGVALMAFGVIAAVAGLGFLTHLPPSAFPAATAPALG